MVQKENNLKLEIILLLIKNKIHLREMARLLNESHSTILRKLNELYKENVLDIKIQGKNKIYFIKNNFMAKSTIYMAEYYKLTKIIKKYPKLTIILNEITKKTKESPIVLFGSYAKFSKEPNDIDIFIETKSKKTKESLEEINNKLNIKIGQIDPTSLLIKEIIKDHVIIRGVEEFYERTKFFV